MILHQLAHTFKTADTFVGASIEGDTLVLAETRNGDEAAEGSYSRLLTVIPLQEAIKIAKALLAAEIQAQEDAYIEEMWQRHQDRFAMEDDALSHDVIFVDPHVRYGVERSVQ